MLNKKEIISIIAVIIILAISISLFSIKTMFFPTLIAVFIVIMLNVLIKKATSHYLNIKIDLHMWEIKQWGFKRHFRFKKPVNLGLILPIILKVLTVGLINWTACLVFDVKSTIYRAAKKHGLYAFSEISETQISVIAAAGILVNLLASIVGYILGFPDFARISLGFAFWNLIPLSDLDGNKIFFGSITLWAFLIALTLIGLALSIFMI